MWKTGCPNDTKMSKTYDIVIWNYRKREIEHKNSAPTLIALYFYYIYTIEKESISKKFILPL